MCAKVAQNHETKEQKAKKPSKGLRFYPNLQNNFGNAIITEKKRILRKHLT